MALAKLPKEALPRRSLCWLARESKPSWFNNEILVHYCVSIKDHTIACSYLHIYCIKARVVTMPVVYDNLFVCIMITITQYAVSTV